MRSNDCTKSSSGGSRRKPFCHPPTPPRCCSGRYLHQGRSTCARSMVGKRLPQNPSISQLTLPPETIPSCDRRMRHTKFQPLSRRHLINSDSLEEYKSQVPQIQQRITYIINLFPSELHIFVRPEIGSLQDLAGKKVNFNTQGTAAAYSGPLIFSRLGIEVEKMFIPHPVALEQLRRGEIAGVVFVTSKPVDAFLKGRWEA